MEKVKKQTPKNPKRWVKEYLLHLSSIKCNIEYE